MKKHYAMLLLFLMTSIGAMAGVIPQFTGSYNASEGFYLLKLYGMYVYRDGDRLKVSAEKNITDAYQFQFVGNTQSFKIYNKASGGMFGIPVANRAQDNQQLVAGIDQNFKELVEGGHTYFQDLSVATCVLNHRNGYVSTWTGGKDAGSRFTVENVPSLSELFTELKTSTKSEVTAIQAAMPTLISAEELATTISAIDAVQEPNSINELEAKRTEVKALRTAFYAKLNNRKVLIKSGGRNRYIQVTADEELGNTTTEATANNVFIIQHVQNNVVKFRYALTGLFVGSTSTYDKPFPTNTTGANYTIVPKEGKLNLRYGIGNQEMMHEGLGLSIVRWEDGVNSRFTFEAPSVTDQQILEAAKARLSTKIGALGARPNVGTGLGQYSVATDVQSATGATDVNAVYTAYAKIVNNQALAINQPQTGQYIRIATAAGGTKKYVTNHDSQATLSADATLSNVFYVAGPGKLISVENGKSFSINAPTGEFAKNFAIGTEGPVLTFAAANSTGTYKISNGTSRYIYAHGNDSQTNAATSYSANSGYDLRLEEVTSLPLPVGATGAATFYATKPLTLSEGYTAYKGKKVDNNIVLTSIDGGVVPARTAFVIKGAASGTCTVTFSNETPQALTDNIFVGFDQVQTTRAAAGTYALGANGATPVFKRFSTTGYQRPFRAYFMNNASGVQAFSLNFDEVTGIEAAAVEASEDAPVYDLSGRRVRAAKGGIYIVNGQKVIR